MKIRPLASEKIDQAFPVVQLVIPHVSQKTWQQFAMSLLKDGRSDRRGILTVEDEQGHIQGLTGYEVDERLDHGRTLVANDLLVPGSLQSVREQIVMGLIQALEVMAQDAECDAIHTLVPDRMRGVRHSLVIGNLARKGHRVEAWRLVKRL